MSSKSLGSIRQLLSRGSACAQRRTLTLQADDALDPRLRAIDVAKLSVQRSTTPKEKLDNDSLVFGKSFTGTQSISRPPLIECH